MKKIALSILFCFAFLGCYSAGIQIAKVVSTGVQVIDGTYRAVDRLTTNAGKPSTNSMITAPSEMNTKSTVFQGVKASTGKQAPDRIITVSNENVVWEFDDYPSQGYIKYFAFTGDSLEKTGYRTSTASDLRKYYIDAVPAFSQTSQKETTDESSQPSTSQSQTSVPTGVKPVSFSR